MLHFKEEQSKKMQIAQETKFPREIIFSVFQVSVFLVVKWHFTENPDSWLASIWNDTANLAITDEGCDAGCSYSTQSTYGNDITEYLKGLTSSQNCILPSNLKIHHHYFCSL